MAFPKECRTRSRVTVDSSAISLSSFLAEICHLLDGVDMGRHDGLQTLQWRFIPWVRVGKRPMEGPGTGAKRSDGMDRKRHHEGIVSREHNGCSN